jgi:endonuclease-3 related protein
MRDRWGHLDWWPGEGALEICVGAVLTQNTNWTNVERAIASLREHDALDLEVLRATPVETLAQWIRPAGYYNVKARRLRAFVQAVAAGGGLERFLDRPVGDLREALLAIHGVGPETADSVILYAAGKCSFVVDAYTRRVLSRHGLIDPRATYDEIQALFETHLPGDVDLYNDYHAQIVQTGKHHCRPTPRCQGCPLEPFPHETPGIGERG